MIFHDRLLRLATRYGALVGLLGAFCVSPALAQQPAPPAGGQEQPAPLELPPLPRHQLPPGETFGDWVKRCETHGENKEQRCYISQILVYAQNNQRRNVLAIAIGYYGPQKTPGAILRLPLGLGMYLPAGLLMTVPGAKPLRIVVETCLPGGCTAAAPLDPEMITAMQKATRGAVEIVNIRRQKLVLPLSFKGFTAGFAALAKG
jgi:invasion protein IalB